MLEIKSENAELFAHILPFMGAFHVQMSFVSAIYKRFKGSGISDVLVAAPSSNLVGWQFSRTKNNFCQTHGM